MVPTFWTLASPEKKKTPNIAGMGAIGRQRSTTAMHKRERVRAFFAFLFLVRSTTEAPRSEEEEKKQIDVLNSRLHGGAGANA